MLRFIAWLLLAAYLLVVGLWPAAAAPIGLVASGAFIVLAQPAVLALVAIAALVVYALRHFTTA